jgi:hypothetical protein
VWRGWKLMNNSIWGNGFIGLADLTQLFGFAVGAEILVQG